MSLFSIVIPAYNQPALLQRAVESVLAQQGTDFEVIITDDSTNDAIDHYARQLADPRVHYLRHQSTGNAIDNWNYGLAHASGDYLILMHHDEALATIDFLLRTHQLFEQGAQLVVAPVEVESNGQRRQPVNSLVRHFVCHHPAWLFFINAIGPCACLAFRKPQTEAFDNRLHWLVDVEWYYRLLSSRRAACSTDTLVRSVHGHEGQISASIPIAETFHHDREIIASRHPQASVRIMLWLYEHLIIRTKQRLHKI